MAVQRQREKQVARPGESRRGRADQGPSGERERPVSDAVDEEPIPPDEEEDDSTEDPLTDPAAEPGKPI